jgi:septum formation protein
MIIHHFPLILASGSVIRQQMLKACGLTFSVAPSGVDEDALKPTLAHLPIPQQALALARAKALAVSARHADAITIGADQMCALGERIFDKPGSYANAESQLGALAGYTHQQHAAVVLANGSEILWEYCATAHLTMRALTPTQIHAYVAADAPISSCGAYKFEALGRHLFTHVDGASDVIQGLPLQALLVELHARGAIGLSA